ncbi:MAG: hypothetical protein ACJ8F3_01505 [Xanthobacteraceae bacterium]
MRRLVLVAMLGWAAPATALRPTSATAQSVITKEGVTAPVGVAPLVTQQNPRALTDEERRRREEALSRTNPPGPPVPVEPQSQRRSPPLPPTDVPQTTPRR